MSSTPLLAASGGLPGPNVLQDHPVFLRASHSPWRFIPQNVLVVLRGLMVAYLVGTGAMIGHYKLTEDSDDGLSKHFFDFSTISYAMVFAYHLTTFSWTFTHLYHPDPDNNEGGVESWIIKAMSLPRNMANLRKQFYFTMFYTAATVFPFMDSTIYWFITRRHDGGDLDLTLSRAAATGTSMATVLPDTPFSDLLGEGWYKIFVVCNLHAVPSAIMTLEAMFCNSVKRPHSLGSHHFGLMALSGLYLGWAAIGKKLTGSHPFFWLNDDEVGSKEAVSAYCMGFLMLSQIMQTLMHGMIGIREGLTRSLSEREARDELDS